MCKCFRKLFLLFTQKSKLDEISVYLRVSLDDLNKANIVTNSNSFFLSWFQALIKLFNLRYCTKEIFWCSELFEKLIKSSNHVLFLSNIVFFQIIRSLKIKHYFRTLENQKL